ncbi:MAG: ribose 5-phosphate isomerase B [Devosia sp.]|nr:ribose 5-phosphate isomerase B [Devosia sp.]
MRVVVGCDEAAFEMKEAIKEFLSAAGHEVTDFGVGPDETALYPDIAHQAATAVAEGRHERAILMCGTGIGVAISANKVSGIRAAQAHDAYSAERAQKSNDAQVLCMGARVIGIELAKTIVAAYMGAHFEGGRSAIKVERIKEYEKRMGSTTS